MKKTPRSNTTYNLRPSTATKVRSRKRWPLLALGGVLFVALVIFTLDRTNVINLTNRKTNKSAVQTDGDQANNIPPANKIDYSPATPTDNQDINNQKESAVPPTTPNPNPTPTPTPPAGDFTINVVQADQTSAGAAFQVRTILSKLSGGTCELRLTRSGQSDIVKTASTIQQPTYMSCAGFDVPISEFHANGDWHMLLKVTDPNGAQKTDERTVQISGAS